MVSIHLLRSIFTHASERAQDPWSTIFAKEDWLNKVTELGGRPLLVGSQLSDLCSSRRKRAHVILLSNFERDEAPSESLKQLLFNSLKEGYTHTQRQKHWGYDEIRVGNITVDVTQALHGGAWLEIRARRIKQLFIFEHKLVRSQYCFFHEREIKALQPQHFIVQYKETIATKSDFYRYGATLKIPGTKGMLVLVDCGDIAQWIRQY
jgi:hypothetical protein